MIKFIQKDDKNFPAQLSFLDSFYYIGELSLLKVRIIAVVGKRDVTKKEMRIAYDVGDYLASEGYVITNGLARGCDKAALEGALNSNGKVIAILPGGLNHIYPSSWKSLANDIVSSGGLLLSEYPPDRIPQKWQFIARDKIQAKIAERVCVIASDEKGGTMHTVKHADRKNILCYWDRNNFHRSGNIYLKNNNANMFSSKLELQKALA